MRNCAAPPASSTPRLGELLIVGALAAAAYGILNHFIPFAQGRDTGTYSLYWSGLFQSDPVYPMIMLFRTPFTPAFFGIAYDLLGAWGGQIAVAFGYVLVALGVYGILATYARWVAVLGVLLVFANLQWFEVFNAPASEAPQTILLIIWTLLAFVAMTKPSIKLGLLFGFCTFLLIMNRPANQLMVAGCFLPVLGFLVAGAPVVRVSQRWLCSLLACGVAVGLTAAYMTYNWARYGEFCVARMGGASVPFHRVFLDERLLRPEHGPYNAELADLVRRKILPDETFRQYEINERTFYEFSTSRMFDALIRASVEERGWDNDFKLLSSAAWESIAADPVEFWKSYIDGVYAMFKIRDKRLFRLSKSGRRFRAFQDERERRYARYESQGLARPSEGDLLLSTGWWLSPDPLGRKERPKPEIWYEPRGWELDQRQPPGERMQLARDWSLKISPSWMQLGVGLLGTVLALLRGRGDPRLLLITLACLPVLLATWLGVLLRFYRFPFDPVFTMFFCYGLYALVHFGQEVSGEWKGAKVGKSQVAKPETKPAIT